MLLASNMMLRRAAGTSSSLLSSVGRPTTLSVRRLFSSSPFGPPQQQSSVSQQQQQKQKRARVILVGSGRMGYVRASLLYANPRFELCGVVDIDYDGASALADLYSSKPYPTLTDAIATEQNLGSGLDAIVVSTPTFTHENVITEAAYNRLDVFTEKPVDETAEKIEKLFDISHNAGISLCCGFQRRFDHSYVAAAKSIQTDNAIGIPLSANIFFADHPSPPKEFMLTGGNIFMDLSAHDVDYIRWVLNDEVSSVYATGTSSTDELAHADVHDNATMIMKFQKGTIVTLFMSRSAAYGYDQRCEIFGDKGLVQVKNEHSNNAVISDVNGIHKSKYKHSFPQRFDQAFGSEIDAFADTILNDTPWSITADDCIKVQRVADAAKQSCEENREIEIYHDNTNNSTNNIPLVEAAV